MSKRIYLGLKDPQKAADVSRKSGIPLSRLQQAAAGKTELTRSELEKVQQAMARPVSGFVQGDDDLP